jgi:hypothetical protein
MAKLRIEFPGSLLSIYETEITDGVVETLMAIAKEPDAILIYQPRLTGAECCDIAVTAAEGGIGYWSRIDEYDWHRWAVSDTGVNREVDDNFVFYTIRFENPTTDAPPDLSADITPALIRRGLQIAITAARKDLVADILNGPREDWMDNLDSDSADCIIQCGVFGEVVFG